MLPLESEPVPLQARRLAVPLLEACPVRRLPLLCMCLSFESSILFEHSVFLRQSFVLVPVAGLISSPKLEQDLATAIRFQGLSERFLELCERVHTLHCGGERSISYQVSQLLVNLLDLYAGRVAYPIDEPESVEAKTTVDEVSGRDGRELPTLKCVD